MSANAQSGADYEDAAGQTIEISGYPSFEKKEASVEKEAPALISA